MKPILIKSKNQMTAIGAFMKAHAEADCKPEQYQTNQGVAPTVEAIVNDLSPEERKRLLDYKGGAVIIYNTRLLSLQLTEDDMHGFRWHLSMTEVADGGLAVPPDSHVLFVLEALFSKTQAVPNPGKVKEILHFVGND